MKCININNAEFQTLHKQSGLPDFYLAAFCGKFVEDHGRFPYLDEVPGVDSSKYLSKNLELKNNYTTLSKILEMTGKETLEEAQISLNHTFRDLEVELVQYSGDSVRVYINKRPILKELEKNINHSPYVNSGLIFENILQKLQSVNGIKLNIVDTIDIQESELKDIPGAVNAKAFIYNGEIYVNIDLADKDAPIHEMMHVVMGELRTLKPDLYYEIADYMGSLPMFEQYRQKFPNRTYSDVAEEAFVEEFAKLASMGTSELNQLPDDVKYELFYHATRALDSILMGESSVRERSDIEVFNKSLIELCDMVGSEIDAGNFKGKMELDSIHRSLANKKQELIENKELEEYCHA